MHDGKVTFFMIFECFSSFSNACASMSWLVKIHNIIQTYALMGVWTDAYLNIKILLPTLSQNLLYQNMHTLNANLRMLAAKQSSM